MSLLPSQRPPQDLPLLRMRMIRVRVLCPTAHGLQVQWWRRRLLNRLIRVFAESASALAALATAACVYAAACDGEHEEDTSDEDVLPVASYGADEVLFLLAGRDGGMRFLRGGEERLRGRASRVCTIQTNVDKVGVRGGGVGQRK